MTDGEIRSRQPARGLRITIVANSGSGGPGGLSSVVRHLRAHLPRDLLVTELACSPDGSRRIPKGWTRPPLVEVPGPAGPITILPYTRPGEVALRSARRLRHHAGASWTLPLLVGIAEGGSLQQAIGPDTDIVHIVGTGFEGLGPAAVRVARRVNARITVWPAIHPGIWGDNHLDAKFYRAADTVFCQSEHERGVVVALGVAPPRAVVCPVGPFDGPRGDAEGFRARWGLGSRPLVVFMGRRDGYKGLRALVDGFAAIQSAVPSAALVVAGPPGDAAPIALDRAWGVDLGTVSSADAADALASADVVCVPSSAEALGIVVLDAWSRAVPVVVGPSPASRELVSCGGGIAVEQSPEQVAGAVIRLLLDPAEAQSMGRAGQAAQRRRFTWDRAVAVHLDVWSALAG